MFIDFVDKKQNIDTHWRRLTLYSISDKCFFHSHCIVAVFFLCSINIYFLGRLLKPLLIEFGFFCLPIVKIMLRIENSANASCVHIKCTGLKINYIIKFYMRLRTRNTRGWRFLEFR